MNSEDAIKQIKTIHDQMAKTNMYKGYKPIALICIGISSLLLGIFQYNIVGYKNYILPWVALGCIIVILLFSRMFYQYIRSSSVVEKSQIKNVFLQFMPGILTCGFIFFAFNPKLQLANYIPGLWAVIFGLSIMSLVPYFTNSIRFISYFYIVSGCIIIYLSKSATPVVVITIFSLVFSLGHFFTAAILYKSQGQFVNE